MFFFKVFFLHRLWTTIAAIGSVNITWWKLDILPGYSTTPNPAEENPMKKRTASKIKIKKKKNLEKNYTFVIFLFFFSSTFKQMIMGSIGYIISSLISTLICACACKLCKKRGPRWIRRLMENDTEDPLSEGQVEEVSSSGGGAVIEMHEFSDTDDSTCEVPMPPSSSVMGSAHVSFVSAPTNNDTVHPVSTDVFPEQQQGAVGGNDHTMSKSVPADFDPYPNIPPKGWLPPIMNIAPGSISIPQKEKIPSKFIEGGWVLHQGMQTEKIIKRVIHRHIQTANTKKK